MTEPQQRDARAGWLYIATVAVMAAGAWATCIRSIHAVAPRSTAETIGLALFVFAGVQLTLFANVTVTYRGSRLSLSFTEIPLLVGIVYLSPAEVLLVVSSALAIELVARRRWSLGGIGNLGTYLASYAAALAAYHGVLTLGGTPVTAAGWLAGAVSVAVALVVSGLLYVGAIAVVRPGDEAWDALRTMVPFTGRTLPPLIVVAASAVALIWDNGWAAVLVAGLLGLAILVLRGRTTLEARYGNLDRLYRSVSRVSHPNEPEEVLTTVLAEAKALVGAGSVSLTIPDGEKFLAFSLADNGGFSRHRIDRVPQLAAIAQDHRRAVLANPSVHDRQLGRALAELGTQCAMAVPLQVGSQQLGTLLATDQERLGHFSNHELAVFEALAANSAVALRSGQLLARLRREAKAREHEALHDALTGLPNRALFTRNLEEALEQRQPADLVAVMLMDLDGFKEVNDTLGHHTGDTILQEVAARLRAGVEENGTVARLGGDEFAFVLPAMAGLDEVVEAGTAILDSLVRPMEAAGLMLGLRASLGVSVAEQAGETAAALLKRADVAMYEAKAAGGGIEVYDPSIDRHTTRRLIVASELRRALDGDAIEVWYQPKANVRTGAVDGVEALLRWTHPQHGPIPPEEFIPAAEQSGLIGPLTWRVIGLAVDQLSRWHDQGLRIGLALNLSARTLLDANLVRRVRRALDGAGVEPRWLTLELTESSIVADPARSMAVLRSLADAGIRLALDDFGTGYSSLTRLKILPIHEVKIDKSFVSQMNRDPGDAAIVRATIELARNLGHTTVAEGVENEATWEQLLDMGCDEAQGYYVARAMPAPSFESWLAHRRPGRLTLVTNPRRAPGA